MTNNEEAYVMTNEEAYEILTHGLLDASSEHKWCVAFQTAIKALKHKRWIPCSERLPEIHQNILLSLRNLDIEVGFRAETEPYFYCHGDYIEPQNVIAWMPLPQPYKNSEE